MNTYVKAATRARLLGNLIRGRASGHPRRRALLAMSRYLHAASTALLDHADEPGPHVPEEAEEALWAARRAAITANAGILPMVVDHVTEPVTGDRVTLTRLDPAHFPHVEAERALAAHLLDLREHGHLDSPDEQIAYAAFTAMLDLHAEYGQLAEDVAEYGRWDRSRPASYRTADGRRTAQHSPGHLAVFEGSQKVADLDVPEDITPRQVWQLIADAA